MEQPTAIVKHKNYLQSAALGIVPCIGLALFLIYRPDTFAAPWGYVAVIVIIAMNFLTTLWLTFKGMSEERFDAGGITLKTPFNTKHYPWAAVESYGIDRVSTKRGWAPVIRLVFRESKRPVTLNYQKDVEQCLRQYRGLPVYNKWEETQKPSP